MVALAKPTYSRFAILEVKLGLRVLLNVRSVG